MNNPAASPVQLARRRLSSVVVDGLEAVGLHLAEQLTHLAIGTVILRDDSPVTAQDVGFRSMDRGRLRAEAAAELIADRAQQTAVVEVPEGAVVSGADLHIVTGQGVMPVKCLRRAAVESPAVLPVLVTGSGWRVGPLLLRDSPVCVDCVEDSGFLDAATDPGGVVALPAVLAAAAVAAQQIQVLVDGAHRCVMEQAALVAKTATGMIAPVVLQPRSECGCLTRVGPPSDAGTPSAVGL